MKISTPEPPRPNPGRHLTRTIAAVTAGEDWPHLEAMRLEHRDQIVARVEYLDRLAAGFRFVRRLDAGLPREIRHGITRRLARVRELAAQARGYARAERWSEAEEFYKQTESAAVNAHHWIRLGRTDVVAMRAFRQRAAASRAGNAAKKRKARARGRRYITRIAAFWEAHEEWSLAAVTAHIRRTGTALPHDSTIRRHLAAAGVKKPK